MKLRLLLTLGIVLFAAGCGKKLDRQIQEQVRTLGGAGLDRERIEIVEVTESGDYAVAEVKIRTAVKMRKSGESWILEEVRLDDRHWESVDRIMKVLNQVRQAETTEMMNDLSAAIRRFTEERGQVPRADSFETLVDILNPAYLEQVLRLDAWANPFRYTVRGAGEFELRSAGEDGRFDSADDLLVTDKQNDL